MSGRVLVLGANGFVRSPLAAALAAEGGRVGAGARRVAEPSRRAPSFDWVAADFSKLTTAQAWAPLLDGVSAVVNCVGVLQDGGGDSTRAAHVDGPRALIAACEAAGVRRLVHISAVGADEAAGTDYARTKAQTERLVAAGALDWLILRPSLVVDRAAFGGTGLIRALAAFPLFSPVVGGDQTFRPIPLGDLCAAIVAALKAGAPSRQSLDMPGPEAVTMVETVRLYRGWLGLKPAPVLPVPRAWAEQLGVSSRGFTRFLAETPASVQDVWHARLWFVRPISILTLGLFWLITGLISFGPGWNGAVAILHEGGYDRWAAEVGRIVVLADFVFTTSAVVVQPISGLGLIHLQGWSLTSPWLLAAYGLYVFVGVCWLPVVWIQYRMMK